MTKRRWLKSVIAASQDTQVALPFHCYRESIQGPWGPFRIYSRQIIAGRPTMRRSLPSGIPKRNKFA